MHNRPSEIRFQIDAKLAEHELENNINLLLIALIFNFKKAIEVVEELLLFFLYYFLETLWS